VGAANFGARRALAMAWHRTSQLTLRISVEHNAEITGITLEGRVAGPWVDELSRAWAEMKPTLPTRKLSIDLRNATYADAAGIRILHEIYSYTAAEIITSTPWTQYLAGEIKRKPAIRNGNGNGNGNGNQEEL